MSWSFPPFPCPNRCSIQRSVIHYSLVLNRCSLFLLWWVVWFISTQTQRKTWWPVWTVVTVPSLDAIRSVMYLCSVCFKNRPICLITGEIYRRALSTHDWSVSSSVFLNPMWWWEDSRSSPFLMSVLSTMGTTRSSGLSIWGTLDLSSTFSPTVMRWIFLINRCCLVIGLGIDQNTQRRICKNCIVERQERRGCIVNSCTRFVTTKRMRVECYCVFLMVTLSVLFQS